MNWLSNPHACYALAAYAVALLGLLGLALVSWAAHRRVVKEWRRISDKTQ